MKRITFSVEDRRRYNPNCESSTVNILIDGQPLAEILRAYELPMATKEGHPALAGDYHAIEVMASLEDYYLGKAEADWGDEENKTQLLGCSCGVSGCWPLLCKINVQGDTVVWSEFEQPHRDEDWDYSAFGVLEFDKQQYLEAVQAMQDA